MEDVRHPPTLPPLQGQDPPHRHLQPLLETDYLTPAGYVDLSVTHTILLGKLTQASLLAGSIKIIALSSNIKLLITHCTIHSQTTVLFIGINLPQLSLTQSHSNIYSSLLTPFEIVHLFLG